MTLYLLTFILFAVGLYGVWTKRHLIRIILGLVIMETAMNLFLILVGYREDGVAPIITENSSNTAVMVDPIPQALVLTAIVIGLATTALLLAFSVRIYAKYQTLDLNKIRNLRG
ncbi:NADH-quinone oxidoreductase subunit K [bacterium]|nr:NADH-quinone oxidoreductase subunit K [bacterium]